MKSNSTVLIIATTLLILSKISRSVLEGECEIPINFLQERLVSATLSHSYSSNEFLFYLHIPRTAGEAFYSCFLKAVYPLPQQCGPNLSTSSADCLLLGSHDDYSVTSQLSSKQLEHGLSVLTTVRDPVDRLISAYEFAIEVGARTKEQGFVIKQPGVIATEDIWPWNVLVPIFQADRKSKADARAKALGEYHWATVHHPDGSQFFWNQVLNKSAWQLTVTDEESLLPPLDPYNNTLVMSLQDFVRHPITKELLHNGQTYQVLGGTNHSFWSDAALIRECASLPHIKDRILELAIYNMDRFIHVGISDQLSLSLEVAAAALGLHLSQPTPTLDKRPIGTQGTGAQGVDLEALRVLQKEAARLSAGENSKRHRRLNKPKLSPRAIIHQSLKWLIVGAYKAALKAFRYLNTSSETDEKRSQGKRAFKRSEVHARSRISQDVIHEIRRLNDLDVQLYAHAKKLLRKQRALLSNQGVLEELPPISDVQKQNIKTSFQAELSVAKFNIPKPSSGWEQSKEEL
ncbi:hypothetical protein CEUSTIGMA_g11790.t1 [Chlamydomonas eustigma]|uniref:Sulfotransferase n=1 Tax=Chlamydomonas eustigma TaxID=1157962 RepID=A0A250XMS4_9CHLO|nr:hypothetical protein CEUSTIGMA_g11790.t1 [Chlamydomonas eustigma]|eukprot:GAX84368.1 hypothetical protein CEUSTIGMA_g11790.t1 [Chlamydomonas eustigma]